ncbi:AP-1 complex subunit beta-1-like [Ruditapes philippinarum]|uniref:AP-1 complex subunit beta-1-like n=1 Tax=Ruditapes philippinarum TaxID=129788 RepID=UPI00295C0E6B|nr:AP-1 complex subunit beta-1-like [Ruditapes philippinarum]
MTDSKYFTTTKKGEIFELKAELNSDKKEKKKEAVKKVIASMTVGKDVSALFPDVVNCMQTDNLELKKLDEDPYVRKTAAVCVAKLHDINAQLVEDQGFLDLLKDLLSDSNPMVVPMLLHAISEIMDAPLMLAAGVRDDSGTIISFLAALNDVGSGIYSGIQSQLTPKDGEGGSRVFVRESAPRLGPMLNSRLWWLLLLSRVVMKLMEMLDTSGDYVSSLVKKLAPPLVTLLSAEPEIQYVALRNINLIVQKRSDILKNEMKVFFVKYNDPIYVKLEKLDIMIRLTSQSNIAQVLAELKEYATEVDVDFVRKSVRAIGRCAIKVEPAAERCVSTLLDLIQTKVNYVVQEAIVVIKDIFRKYPNKYESIIATLCENLDTLDEPEARASMIWIIGEYAERIDNADELLESFLEGFQDENTQVQLQLLTAIVKLFLKRPTDTQELVQQVLSLSTQDSDNPDLRDRGYIYWRLLSTDPAAAKEVVLAEKPLISEETDLIEPTLLDELICHISSLASVYHKPPNAFVEGRGGQRRVLPAKSQQEGTVEEMSAPTETTQQPPQPTTVIPGADSLIGDLLDIDLGPGPSMMQQQMYPQQPPVQTQASGGGGGMDIFGEGLDNLLGGGPSGGDMLGGLGDIFGMPQSQSYIPPQEVWLPAPKGKGMEITGTFARKNNQINMELTFTNKAMQPMTGFAIQFNKNSFGLMPAQVLNIRSPLPPNQSASTSLPLNTTGPIQKMEPLTLLQVAIKNNIDVFYLSTQVPLHVLFAEDGEMEKKIFLATWKDIPASNEVQYTINNDQHSADTVSQKLRNNNVFTIAKRNVEGQDMLYQSLKLTNGIWVLAELKIQPSNPTFVLSLKSRAVDVYEAVRQVYVNILHN